MSINLFKLIRIAGVFIRLSRNRVILILAIERFFNFFLILLICLPVAMFFFDNFFAGLIDNSIEYFNLIIGGFFLKVLGLILSLLIFIAFAVFCIVLLLFFYLKFPLKLFQKLLIFCVELFGTRRMFRVDFIGIWVFFDWRLSSNGVKFKVRSLSGQLILTEKGLCLDGLRILLDSGLLLKHLEQLKSVFGVKMIKN